VRHGYGIKRDVEVATAGTLHLGPGTLYEAIHRMEAQGWIEEVDRRALRQQPDYDARARYYRLTGAGRDEMEAELARLDEIVKHARKRAIMPGRRGTS
jgi:DNA-binding PadR family transcriptional regulator